MERLSADLPGDVRKRLGPENKGVADDLGVFLDDHREIESFQQLSAAIRENINEVGGFQFYTRNPMTEQIFRGIESQKGVTMALSKELTNQTLEKLSRVVPDQLH